MPANAPVAEPRRRPSVLVIGLNYAPEPTGSAPYTAGLAEMIAAFADVQVLAGVPHYPAWRVDAGYRWRLRRRERRNSVDVRHFRHFVPRRQTAVGRALWDASFVLNGLTSRAARRPDVVIASTPSLGGAVLGAQFARRYRVPYGVVIQDLVGRAARQSGISGGAAVAETVGRVEGWALRRADLVAVVSQAFRTHVEAYGVDPDKIRLLPNWTHIQGSTKERAAVRAELGWRQGEFIALHSGNMGLKQDLGNVIDAARELVKQPHIRIALCGDGNQRDQLQRQAAGLSNVSFLPPVSNERYSELLGAADLLLVNERPSVSDMALPSKLTSYFSAGRGVLAAVSADGACAHEIAKTSGAALVVAPGEPASLAAAIEKLSADPEALSAMGTAGVRYAEKRLGRAAAAGRARQLVEDLIGRPIP